MGTGRFEQLPPPHIVEELYAINLIPMYQTITYWPISTSIYFTRLQTDSVMIHGDKYITSLYRPPHMQPPMCLQYSVLAAGASASSTYGHLAEAFYSRARHYIQADEMLVG